MSNPVDRAFAFPYRPDIDGLRALAVLGVVIFHVNPAILPGGFFGVDIFFVISGYLISSFILHELADGTFSFTHFYARRIRRLFPALITVLLAVLIFGVFALYADEYRQLARHAYASIAFLENFRLMDEAGYFDAASYTKPLMHLWSLSIEEQFYLVCPLLLLLAWKWGKRLSINLVVVLLLCLLIASFLFTLDSGLDETNLFFHPLARIWELLAGVGLACWHGKRGHALSSSGIHGRHLPARLWSLLSLTGLGAMLACFGLWRTDLVHPGWITPIPVLGAVALLASPASAPGNRLLALKTPVWIGLISYPLYLWHWPILSFLRIMESSSPSSTILWAGALFSIGLAALTWRFIELPIRGLSTGQYKIKSRVPGLCGSMVCLFIIAYGMFVLEKRLTFLPVQPVQSALDETRDFPIRDASCLEKFPLAQTLQYCRLEDTGASLVAVIGDSHALAPFAGIARLARKYGYGALLLASHACLFHLGRVHTTAEVWYA
ncbi:MAG: acyltransferase [Zoogloeaceae bacterium]|jgi:peptidoglycan/LPS O-acetylase OafA/YrhL|nr:acyltransferase [Zoogloeaceae bacterium]